MPTFPLRLYNTLSRRVEDFTPLKKSSVGLYTCGPTVYNYAHLGNLRTYIFEDLLERTLRALGYSVKRVMNITDVGHLTGDTDAGEDKLDKEAKAQKKSVEQIARFYTKAFLADLKKLNIVAPKTLAPASKYVPEQVAMVRELMKRGFAYETKTAVYFDVQKFSAYGKLSGQKLEQKLRGARREVVEDPEKRHAADFALWFKRVGKFKQHILHWPSPWGDGFPGWHIECSAISRKFLGQPFDIHTGGVDHIGTHHENEIAQAEAAYGKPLARYWLHGEFLLVDAGKMAKSEGNFLTVAELERKKVHPLAFRYLALTTHYRSPLNFSWVALDQARQGLSALIQKVLYVDFLARGAKQRRQKPAELEAYRARFLEAAANDLNIPRALGVLHELTNNRSLTQRSPGGVRSLVYAFDEILGLGLKKFAAQWSQTAILKNKELRPLLAERATYRTRQQFIQADRLRKKIHALGYGVEDTPAGTFVVPTSLL